MERPVRYVRENFWQGITFSSLEDLNHQAASWLDTVAIPWHLAGRDVLIRILPDRQHMKVLWQEQVVARHALMEGHGQFVKEPAHFQGLQRAKTGSPFSFCLREHGRATSSGVT